MAREKSESRYAVSSAHRYLASQVETVRSGPLAPYLLRRGIEHLLEVGRPDTTLTLLPRFDYLMDRLRTLPNPDGVLGLGEDWRATLRLSPIPDHATRLWESFYREREHILPSTSCGEATGAGPLTRSCMSFRQGCMKSRP